MAPAGGAEVRELGPVPGWPLLPPAQGGDGPVAGHKVGQRLHQVLSFIVFYPGWRRAHTSSMSMLILHSPRMRRELVLSKTILLRFISISNNQIQILALLWGEARLCFP